MRYSRTAITDTDKKNDLIEHLNEDHPKELLLIAQTYADPHAVKAQLKDIFQEGIIVTTQATELGDVQEHWVNFVIKGDLEEQVLYLAYDAITRKGGTFGSGKKTILRSYQQYICDNTYVTVNTYQQ